MEEEDLFERLMEEILALLEATSTEDGSAKRLQQLYDRKDLIAVLPTGYVKSLIFQLLVLLEQNGITIHLSFNCKCSLSFVR